MLDKKVIAKQFKKDTGAIIAALTSMEEDEIEKLEAQARFIFFRDSITTVFSVGNTFMNCDETVKRAPIVTKLKSLDSN